MQSRAEQDAARLAQGLAPARSPWRASSSLSLCASCLAPCEPSLRSSLRNPSDLFGNQIEMGRKRLTCKGFSGFFKGSGSREKRLGMSTLDEAFRQIEHGHCGGTGVLLPWGPGAVSWRGEGAAQATGDAGGRLSTAPLPACPHGPAQSLHNSLADGLAGTPLGASGSPPCSPLDF